MEHILAKDLRDAVLQAALEGKLTTREQNDSCINETLLEIKNDINIKLKNKEIKKLPLFEDSCEDYDSLPDKWIGVRLGQISYFISKGTTPRGGNVAYVDNGIGFLRAENVAGYDKLSFENLKYVTAEMNEGFLQRSKLQENDILITIAGTLGRTGLVRKSDLPLNANQAVSIVRTYPEKLNLRYLIMAINAPSVQKSFLDLTRTTAIPNLTLEIISNIYIPLPPIEEQQRIVDKVDELMAKIDEYEKIENQLVQLREEFPGDMRDAIVHSAIQGKLTQHNLNDLSVENIIKECFDRKTVLINSKQIKKEPQLSNDYDIPFDIPDNWKWCKLGDLITYQNGYSYKPEETTKKETNYPVIKSQNLMSLKVKIGRNNDYVVNPTEKMLASKINKGDLLMCLSSQSSNPEPLGKTAIYDLDYCALLNQRVLKMTCLMEELTNYLYIVLNSEYFHFGVSHQGNGLAQANLKLEHVREMMIPLPPIEEQQRIVDLLDKVLPLCDSLQS